MSFAQTSASGSLEGATVLVVEDEAIISFLIEDMLTAVGCQAVWHAGSVREALALLGDRRPDAAVLDVNLSGETVLPVAEQLRTLGVPFVFATGYGAVGIPKGWEERPVIQKPFTLESLEATLRGAFPSSPA